MNDDRQLMLIEDKDNIAPAVTEEAKKLYGAMQRGARISAQFVKLDNKIQTIHNRVAFFNRDRNYLCPCKSGKKFKHCCIHHLDTARGILGKLEKAKVKLTKKLKQLKADNKNDRTTTKGILTGSNS